MRACSETTCCRTLNPESIALPRRKQANCSPRSLSSRQWPVGEFQRPSLVHHVRCGKKKRVSHSLLRSVAGPPSTATRKRRHQAFRHDTDREMPYKIPISVSVQRPAQTCRPCDLSPLATRHSLVASTVWSGELSAGRARPSSFTDEQQTSSAPCSR